MQKSIGILINSSDDKEIQKYFPCDSTVWGKGKIIVTTSDSNGNWSYLLPEDLELGPHTIVLKTKDRDGKLITMQRNFTIIALQGNEGRVLGTGTGEPTIIFTTTPIPPIPTM